MKLPTRIVRRQAWCALVITGGLICQLMCTSLAAQQLSPAEKHAAEKSGATKNAPAKNIRPKNVAPKDAAAKNAAANNPAAKNPAPNNVADRDAARRQADEVRREWLRKQLPKLIPNQAELNAVLAQVDGLNGEQINDLANLCLDELQARRAQGFAILREQNERERAFQREVARALVTGFDPFPAIGYVPVVTWLPEGVSLSAQAVVSPDGRSVRMQVLPIFSSIGPVYTFNYMTGETRRLPQFDPPPPPAMPPVAPRREIRP